jgi:hypothetical protein
MPYELLVVADRKYAVLKCSGALSLGEGAASGKEVIERAGQDMIERLLVDVSAVTSHWSTQEFFFMTREHASLGPPRPRVALLGRPDQEADLRFIENVGVNRGMPIKAFVDEADAARWLFLNEGQARE